MFFPVVSAKETSGCGFIGTNFINCLKLNHGLCPCDPKGFTYTARWLYPITILIQDTQYLNHFKPGE